MNTSGQGSFALLLAPLYPGFVMNQLGINHTGSVGHQPYPGFVMNQLGINHTGSVGHQPYPGFVLKN